ncbi:hypothetical protein LQK93_03749 [Terrabacter sp. BE26]
MTTASTEPRKPLLCRLNLHHKWQMDHSPGRGVFRRCIRCGRDDRGAGDWQRPSPPSADNY